MMKRQMFTALVLFFGYVIPQTIVSFGNFINTCIHQELSTFQRPFEGKKYHQILKLVCDENVRPSLKPVCILITFSSDFTSHFL